MQIGAVAGLPLGDQTAAAPFAFKGGAMDQGELLDAFKRLIELGMENDPITSDNAVEWWKLTRRMTAEIRRVRNVIEKAFGGTQ